MTSKLALERLVAQHPVVVLTKHESDVINDGDDDADDVIASLSFRFNPNQSRDERGRWADQRSSPLSDIMDVARTSADLDDLDANVVQQLDQRIGGPLGSGHEMRVSSAFIDQMSRMTPEKIVRDPYVFVTVDLHDRASGDKVGEANVDFVDGENGRYGIIDTIHVNDTGQGLGTQFIAELEDRLQRFGADRVEISQAVDAGGYVWARLGYNFRDQRERKTVRDQLARVVSEYATGTSDQQAQVADARDIIQRVDAGEAVSAREISDVGRPAKATAADTWIGKDALLNSGWIGVKTFDDNVTAALSFKFNPKQLRDPNTGKWVDAQLSSATIAGVPLVKKKSVYKTFNGRPNTYMAPASASVYSSLHHTADKHDLSMMQVVMIVDELRAKENRVPNKHAFREEMLDWLTTPAGTAAATGQAAPKPSTPAFSPSVNNTTNIPPLEASNMFSYAKVTPKQADALWGVFTRESSAGKLTSAQRNGVHKLTGSSSAVNAYLRGDEDEISLQSQQNARDAQLAMRPSTQPMLLHREVRWGGIGGAETLDELTELVGTEWQNSGFSHTSVGGHASYAGEQMPITIEIEAPPGTPMVWAKPISQAPSENEMLLAAGTTYHILSVTPDEVSDLDDDYDDGERVTVRVRVIPTNAGVVS